MLQINDSLFQMAKHVQQVKKKLHIKNSYIYILIAVSTTFPCKTEDEIVENMKHQH